MKSILCLALASSALLSAPAHADDLVDLYKYLHQNPELSNMETQTAAYLAERLEDLGFDVTEGVGGTGVVAVLENGSGPTVMVRADMDALPVKEQTGVPYASTVMTKNAEGETQPAMHACGHDIHMASFMGTAEQLVDRRSEWSGTAVMILQPAEELGQGARQMIADGIFERFPRPDYNLALHVNSAMPAGTVGWVPGFALANVNSVDITVRGVGGHGAYPHTTKDPVVLAAQLVLALQTITSREISAQEPSVVTVGSIHGGTKHNIIGDEVKLQLTLRSYSDDVRDQQIESIKRIAKGLAEAAGLPNDKLPIVTVRDEFTPSTFNDPSLAKLASGFMADAIGEQNVKQVSPVMGGEDFGQFGRVEPKIPSMIFWLGAVNAKEYTRKTKAGEQLPSLHSPFFAPDAKPTLDTGVAAMTAAVIGLMNHP